MGLDYDILRKKKKITIDGEQRLNLLSNSYNRDYNMPFAGIRIIKVTKEYVGRPDLISLGVYGDDSYADIICKINGISNPFELNTGMELVCPALSMLEQLTATPTDDITDDTIEDTREIVSNSAPNKKLASEERSPNEATIGDDNYYVSDDRRFVVY